MKVYHKNIRGLQTGHYVYVAHKKSSNRSHISEYYAVKNTIIPPKLHFIPSRYQQPTAIQIM